jgi:hypothetical protein
MIFTDTYLLLCLVHPGLRRRQRSGTMGIKWIGVDFGRGSAVCVRGSVVLFGRVTESKSTTHQFGLLFFDD